MLDKIDHTAANPATTAVPGAFRGMDCETVIATASRARANVFSADTL
jgi:hypothetical protein